MKILSIKSIALFEAFKGFVALTVALGLHVLAGDHVKRVGEILVSHLHINPANQLPNIIMHAANDLTDVKLLLISIGAILYALVRFLEAYGLWHQYRWTEWFALISGAIYLPFEFYELVTTHRLISALILTINLMIVIYMYKTIKRRTS